MITMKLTGPQLSITNHVAVMRRISNEQKKIKPKHGAPTGKGSWEGDIKSCSAELAVALYTNLVWCGTVGQFDQRDVGGLIEVRATQPHYHLRLHPADLDPVPFVLVWWREENMYEYDLMGWVFAHEGKMQKWFGDPWRTKRPAFWVPPKGDHLRPMETLLDWVHEQRGRNADEEDGVA